ncbi:hypothetical protein [Fimbriiglobus ruber]|uniref:hypothetical protein n=1 Tax=Fimbriiglobus ruber TaxID=1908690 RepID=UPI000B4C041C|nr:hypothetical protein [Fimbriiglobus ruber]
MITAAVDKNGKASRAAAEGAFALGKGDTATARQKYAEAGTILEGELAAARRPEERNLLCFLAASQYYHGGEYKKAIKLAKRIEAKYLTEDSKRLLPKFLRDVETRSSPDYQIKMEKALRQLFLAGEPARVLGLLIDHPYLYEYGRLAFIRAVLCEQLGQYRVAAQFYAMAARELPDGKDVVRIAAAYPLKLRTAGRLDEAWSYITCLLDLLPVAILYMVASILCFSRGVAATGETQRKLHLEQVEVSLTR